HPRDPPRKDLPRPGGQPPHAAGRGIHGRRATLRRLGRHDGGLTASPLRATAMPDTPPAVKPAPAPAPADAEVYKPLSGPAIVGLAVAVLAAVIIVVIGIVAKVKGRPVLSPYALFLAGLGLALSAAARWQIVRSGGTRAGLRLTTVGLWLG